MKTKIHIFGAVVATFCIATFFVSTVIVEIFGSHESVAIIKRLIVMPGLLVLIPAIALTGGSGFVLGKKRSGRLLNAKKKRMPIIAANGLLVLVPAALFLHHWAALGVFDTRFYVVQALELIAGGVNLLLMWGNIRDGLKMAGINLSELQH